MRRYSQYAPHGPIFFITTVLQDRYRLFTSPRYVVPLYDSLLYYTAQHPCRILGYVIMPDHIHLLLWPSAAADVSALMCGFKTFTAKRLIRQAEAEGRKDLLERFRRAGQEHGHSEHKVWEDSFWQRDLFTAAFVREKLVYLHDNPLRAGLVDEPAQYPYSSFCSYEYGKDDFLPVYRGWQ